MKTHDGKRAKCGAPHNANGMFESLWLDTGEIMTQFLSFLTSSIA